MEPLYPVYRILAQAMSPRSLSDNMNRNSSKLESKLPKMSKTSKRAHKLIPYRVKLQRK